MQPTSRVLDLFAVPSAAPLAASAGAFVAGDLVLSPVAPGDRVDRAWLAPTIARLAVRLDEDPCRRPGSLRLAVPVPARDGSIVVDGWEAHRFEPGSRMCRDLPVTRAAGRLLHARLGVEVPHHPAVTLPTLAGVASPPPATERTSLLQRVEGALAVAGEAPPRRHQLVHAGLHGRVLLDPDGSPVVLQLVAAWDLPSRADARCVVEAAIAGAVPGDWNEDLSAVQRRRLLEAVETLLVGARRPELSSYAAVLDRLDA